MPAPLYLKALPYIEDGAAYFAKLHHQPYAIFLDSGPSHLRQGRYDIISALPQQIITTNHEQQLDPFIATQTALAQLPIHDHQELPFTIGAMGYFAYDCGRLLEKIPTQATADIQLPWAVIGIYTWSIVTDHQLKKSFLITLDKDFDLEALLTTPTSNNFQLKQKFQANLSFNAYADRFEKIKYHLRQGNIYQINLCQRFSSAYQGDPWDAYQTLRQCYATPFAAYMNLPTGAILSFSPERFIQARAGYVETKPIKGTIARHSNPQQDQQHATTLLNSSKDRAENTMIVDLLRNDFGRCCVPGSIQVTKLCALESFKNVHHLVSTIIGQLQPNQHPLSLLRAAFPGGSITGAPKIRAMTLIDELEPVRRNVYCGAIGYCDVKQSMDFNIAIRTLICDDQKIHAYAGGGIVYDSELTAEYQESLTKIQHLTSALEQHFLNQEIYHG